jgi:hypothetical protein
MKKIFLIILILIAVLFFVINKKPAQVPDFKTAQFQIEGKTATIGKELTYFGNDFVTDLNNDGRDDVVFLVTSQPGGSGTFYYAVAALNTEEGYRGSDGYFLGDRIAPQTINLSPNPKHKNVVVVNYADRAPSEPMTAQPSVAKSAYLKLDSTNIRWGIVEPDFEGESNIQTKIQPVTPPPTVNESVKSTAKIISPNGGETVTRTPVGMITYDTGNMVGKQLRFKLINEETSEVWEIAGTDRAKAGIQNIFLVVPPQAGAGSKYKIGIKECEGEGSCMIGPTYLDVSDGYFSIK